MNFFAGKFLSICMLLFLFGMSSGLSVTAAKLYKYRDENGNLAFSDKPMNNSNLVQVEQAEVFGIEPRFSVQKEGPKDDFTLIAVNDYFGPVEIEFRIDQSQNIISDYKLPKRFTIAPITRKETVSFWRKNPKRGYSYTYSYSYVLGDPRARHLPLVPYLLPVSTEIVGKFKITQAFNGTATHIGPQSQFAVDFAIPEGTDIYAARSGIIMDVANDFFRGGKTEEDKQRANYVRVLHDDGTMALYAHLALESVQFAVGLRVERGQVIGKSGNTGYSSGPHLHFAIQKNYGMELRSLPFEFEGVNGQPFKPEAGMVFDRSDY